MSCNATIAKFVVCFSLFAVSAPSAFAATVTKVPTGTDLTAGASWLAPFIPPDPNDTATWSGPALGSGLTLGSSKQWSAISVSGAASDIAISGAVNAVANSGYTPVTWGNLAKGYAC
jgi:hypothetical protein